LWIKLESNELFSGQKPSDAEDGHSHTHHLNIRAALIHVVGDLIQSIGVLISSVIIKLYPGSFEDENYLHKFLVTFTQNC
jgi:hypothetical protein